MILKEFEDQVFTRPSETAVHALHRYLLLTMADYAHTIVYYRTKYQILNQRGRLAAKYGTIFL